MGSSASWDSLDFYTEFLLVHFRRRKIRSPSFLDSRLFSLRLKCRRKICLLDQVMTRWSCSLSQRICSYGNASSAASFVWWSLLYYIDAVFCILSLPILLPSRSWGLYRWDQIRKCAFFKAIKQLKAANGNRKKFSGARQKSEKNDWMDAFMHSSEGPSWQSRINNT